MPKAVQLDKKTWCLILPTGGGEHTVCGNATDEYDFKFYNYKPAPEKEVTRTQQITCNECRRGIAEIKLLK